jgi:hypothetical protein
MRPPRNSVHVPAAHRDLSATSLATATYSVANEDSVPGLLDLLGVRLVALERLQEISEELSDSVMAVVGTGEFKRSVATGAAPDDVRVVEREHSLAVPPFRRRPKATDQLHVLLRRLLR